MRSDGLYDYGPSEINYVMCEGSYFFIEIILNYNNFSKRNEGNVAR